MTRACAVSRKKEQILRFVDAQKSVLAVDAYKRLGDYMLRNELGTTILPEALDFVELVLLQNLRLLEQ